MQVAPGILGQPPSSLHPPASPPSAEDVSATSHSALASGNLATFLQPSFDASTYVSELISGVDARLDAARAATQPASPSARLAVSAGGLLQPVSPGSITPNTQKAEASRSSILLSPSATTPAAADGVVGSSKAQAAQRKREQDQEEVDLSLAISRLNLAIEELDRSISTQVTANAPELLQRTSRLTTMQQGLEHTRHGVQSLDIEVANLRRKVHDPFVRLTELQADLRLYDGAGELVAKAVKFVDLARRLETQMEALFVKKDSAPGKTTEGEAEDAVVGQVHGRDLSRAALLIHEISAMLDTGRRAEEGQAGLLALKLVQDVVPVVESARKTVVDYMEDMIVRGLRDLSPVMLASSLQTAFNLGTLPTLVKDLLDDLTEVVKERTAAALDLDAIARQIGSALPSLEAGASSYTAYRSGRRGRDDGSAQRQQQQAWSDALWKRLEALIVVEMGAVCSKVYLLEKVLKLKSDSETGVNFLAAALDVLGDRPSHTFWRTWAQCLQQQVAGAAAKSPWVAQLLSSGVSLEAAQGTVTGVMGGYTRLLRLLHEFFAKITVYTDVQYMQTHQSAEAVVLLRGLAPLEKGYVDKATWRVAEVLSQVVAPTRRTPLDAGKEADGVVALVANAVDAVRFDPLLLRAVTDRCTALVEQYAARLGGVVAQDTSAWILDAHAAGATASQSWNATLVRFSHALAVGLSGVASEHVAVSGKGTSVSYAATRLQSGGETIVRATRTLLLEPLLHAAEQTIGTAMGKMHAQLAARGAVQQRGVAIDATSGASAYVSEVCDTLAGVRENLLPLYPPQLRTALAGVIAHTAAEVFLLHAGLVALPEDADAVKLRLATDMTELEFALTQILGDAVPFKTGLTWVEDADGRNVIKAIKAFRRVLFLETPQIENEVETLKADTSLALAVTLHIFSRSDALDQVLSSLAPKQKAEAAARSDLVRSALDDMTTVTSRIRSTLVELPLDGHASRIVDLLLPASSEQ